MATGGRAQEALSGSFRLGRTARDAEDFALAERVDAHRHYHRGRDDPAALALLQVRIAPLPNSISSRPAATGFGEANRDSTYEEISKHYD